MASSSSSSLFSGSGFSGLASSSSSSSLASRYKTLGELDWGVVKTFKPTHAQLVCGFFNRKIQCDSTGSQEKEAFPELEIYGKKGNCPGIEPWEIWDRCRPIMCPHQDYVYFYTKLQKLGKAGRLSRIVGYGGTWSETETVKHLQFNKQSPSYGKLRRFRYENKDKNHQQHAEWLMDEFTSNNSSPSKSSSSEWALCRIKINDSKKGRKRKYEEQFGCSGDIFDYISLDDDDDDLTLTCLPPPLIQQFDPGKQQLEMPNSWGELMDARRDYCPVVPVQSNQETCSSITNSFQPEEDTCDFSEDQLLQLEMELSSNNEESTLMPLLF